MQLDERSQMRLARKFRVFFLAAAIVRLTAGAEARL
jgi:hypothetical protein